MVLRRYSILNSYYVRQEEIKHDIVNEVVPLVLEDNSKLITLSEMSPISKGYITVHRMSDYRHKDNSILLIPYVEATIDKLLFNREEVTKCSPIP